MQPPLTLMLAGALLGAAVGSYLGCAAYRLPRRISLRGRSFCPGCSASVAARHNLPVIGFLLLRGRSACCDTRLSRHYLVYETAAAATGAALALVAGLPVMFAVAAAIVALSVSVAAWLRCL